MPHLDTATWPQVGDRPTVLIPLGSTEQHGAHLPMATDTIIATAVADRLGETVQAVVAPAIPYGSSGEHQGFPGTVSIGEEALHLVLIEAVRSLTYWAGRVIIVNAHGGNLGALARASAQLIAEGHQVCWVPCSDPGGDAHAGFTETSILLHLAPDSVHLLRATPGNTQPLPEIIERLTRDGVRAVSTTGVLGDPTGATASAGERILEDMVASVVRRTLRGVPDARGCLRDPGVG